MLSGKWIVLLGSSRVPPWVLSGAAIDLDFAGNRIYGGTAFSSFVSVARASPAITYAETLDGSLTPFAANVLRITNQGCLLEEARTNVVLWNRDLTNASWAASNVTVAKDQTGAEGTANAASSLTATAGNGTVLQAITLGSSARWQSAYVKRLSGSGTINMTMDNGATWTAIVPTASWTKLSIPSQTLANPTVGFRIVTSGDVIAVDFVQNEAANFHATSPIPTTTVAVTRSGDNATLIGNALAAMAAAQGAVLMTMSAWPTSASGFVLMNPAATNRYLHAPTGSLHRCLANAVSLDATLGSPASYYSGTPKCAVAWSAAGRSFVANNGTVATDASAFVAANPSIVYGSNAGSSSPNAYHTRLTFWNLRLSDAPLKAFT